MMEHKIILKNDNFDYYFETKFEKGGLSTSNS